MASTPSNQSSGIQRTVLQALPIPNLPGWESRLVLLEYPPACSAPVHHHPTAATGYVLQGAVISQWAGQEIEHYSAGESFVDLAGTRHLRSENASPTEWMKMVVSYVVKIGEPNVVMD